LLPKQQLLSAAAAAGGSLLAAGASWLPGSSTSHASAVCPLAAPLVKPMAVKNCQACLLARAMSVTSLAQGCLRRAAGGGTTHALSKLPVQVAAHEWLQSATSIHNMLAFWSADMARLLPAKVLARIL
jgi:hypothetical protein